MNENLIYLGMVDQLEKTAESAKGIPDKEKASSPSRIDRFSDPDKLTEFVIQEHDADQAGKHYDLRIADPNKRNTGLSWAVPKAEEPKPGDKKLAIQQPDHDTSYFDFTGEIEDGYGKGEVKQKRRTKAEILEANNDRVKFNLYDKRVPEEFLLQKTDDEDGPQSNWLLINNTPTREREQDIPESKTEFKELDPEDESVKGYLEDNEHLMQEKLDGAHNIVKLKAGENPRIYSHRKAKNPTGLINHTWNIKNLEDVKTPEELDDTILRAEIYGEKKQGGEALPVNEVGGILNSKVLKSRKKQDEKGELRTAAFDIEKYKGQDVSDANYEDKHEILKTINKIVPQIELPRTARKPSSKRELYNRIKRGKDKRTEEGVIFKNPNNDEKDIRVKFNPEYDVEIDDIFEAGEGTKYEGSHAGGFVYKWPGDNESAGKIGTGFSDEMRKDMHDNPDKYKGKVIKVKAHDVYPKKDGQNTQRGALRMPVFKAFHPDKNDYIPDTPS